MCSKKQQGCHLLRNSREFFEKFVKTSRSFFRSRIWAFVDVSTLVDMRKRKGGGVVTFDLIEVQMIFTKRLILRMATMKLIKMRLTYVLFCFKLSIKFVTIVFSLISSAKF